MLGWLLDARLNAWNPQLRTILLGGEAARLDLVQRCMDENLPIAVSYGLTEATSQAATATTDEVRRKPGHSRQPLPGTQIRIVNESGEALDANERGEVLVMGGTVTRGYYGDAQSTAKALRGGWLHSGDIGCLDEDGDLFIFQRHRDLIVSGGENVYPAEVEAALRGHPAVAEALVFGLPDNEWGQRVAALIELNPGKNATSEDLQASRGSVWLATRSRAGLPSRISRARGQAKSAAAPPKPPLMMRLQAE